LQLLAAIAAGGHWFRIYAATRAALHMLPQAAKVVADDLVGVATDSAKWTARTVAKKLTKRQRFAVLERRTNLFPPGSESPFDEPPLDLIVGAILPPLTKEQIDRMVNAHGWTDRIQALTKLANPESLATQIASMWQAGKSVAEIAREIRPLVQGVQTSARRVARTAGLWIAHEAELHTYEQLGDIIEGYTVNAVLDHATRPEHRKRDGDKFYRVPGPGQKSFYEMPRPPRESPKDGNVWAFNCRCFLSPILAG